MSFKAGCERNAENVAGECHTKKDEHSEVSGNDVLKFIKAESGMNASGIDEQSRASHEDQAEDGNLMPFGV